MYRKTVLVTGSAKGLGKAIATSFAKDGARVLLADSDRNALKECAHDLDKFDVKPLTFCLDVSDESQVEPLFFRNISDIGGVDVLINNAAISPKGKGGRQLSIFDIDMENWGEVLRANVQSVALCSKFAAKSMIERKEEGVIVNIASMMGITGSPQPGNNGAFPVSNSGAHYSASKAAVLNLTKSLAREFAPYGIRVNAVSPGAINSGMLNIDRELELGVRRQIAFKKLADPNEVVSVVRFLANSKLSSYLTGENVNVNGGWLM